MEKALGDKVDIDGDTMTVKGDDGEKVTIGGKWPDSKLAKKIPEFKKGNVVSSMETNEGVTISLENVKAKDAKPYIEKIKKEYSKDSSEYETDGTLIYSGFGDDNIEVSICYAEKDETFFITIAKTVQ